MRTAHKILIGKPEGKRAVGRIRCRWEDNIKMELTETGWECVWTGFIWLWIETSGGLLWTR